MDLIVAPFVIFVIALLIFVALFLGHPSAKKSQLSYTADQPRVPIYREIYNPSPDCDRVSYLLADQPESIMQGLREFSKTLKTANVKKVIFVHGTFVGDDPFGAFEFLNLLTPWIDPGLLSKMKTVVKRQAGKIVKDTGNFISEYVELVQDGLGQDIQCSLFDWSSANHHSARLAGTCRLVKSVSEVDGASFAPRVLLLAHSHGGQLFALMSHLLSPSVLGSGLWNSIAKMGIDGAAVKRELSIISRLYLDFVTFGTPPLYKWNLSSRHRLLNFINHRGNSHLGGDVAGIWRTRDGDYVQQLGILGSDIKAPSPQTESINRELDEILGPGRDRRLWLSNLKIKMRVIPFGRTVLVDYGDQSKFLPNFAKTLLGHGVYTRLTALPFHLRMISKYFYR
jgi:hypothetical protein